MFGYVCYTSALRDEMVCLVIDHNGHFVEERLLPDGKLEYGGKIEYDNQFFFVQTLPQADDIMISDIARIDGIGYPYEEMMAIADDTAAQSRLFAACKATFH